MDAFTRLIRYDAAGREIGRYRAAAMAPLVRIPLADLLAGFRDGTRPLPDGGWLEVEPRSEPEAADIREAA